jgi:hypothetical protein
VLVHTFLSWCIGQCTEQELKYFKANVDNVWLVALHAFDTAVLLLVLRLSNPMQVHVERWEADC